MADNKTFQSATPATLPANTIAATKEVSFSGNTADVQLIELVAVTGTEGSRTLNEITTADGVKVQAGANLNTSALLTEADFDTKTGALTETAPATDTASSGLNGRLQRIAQRLTSLIALLPAALGANGGLKVEGVASGTAVPVSAASLPLPTGAGTLAEQQSQTTHLATIASDTTGIKTAVEIMDDWDESDRAKVNIIPGQAGVTAGAGAVAANTQRVTLASDDPAVTALQILDNAISGSEMQVDIVAMPNVTLAAGTNTNEVVGDAAHDAAAAGNPVLIAGIAQDMDDTAPPNVVSAESDATRLATDRDGALFVHTHGPRVWSYHLNTSTAQTDTEVHAAPAAGLSLYVGTIVFSADGTAAINAFFEEGSTKVLGPFYLPATAGGFKLEFNPPKKITAATALTLTTSASHAHAIDITGFTGQG